MQVRQSEHDKASPTLLPHLCSQLQQPPPFLLLLHLVLSLSSPDAQPHLDLKDQLVAAHTELRLEEDGKLLLRHRLSAAAV